MGMLPDIFSRSIVAGGAMADIVRKSRQTENVFCPTGTGGGIDPTCSPGLSAESLSGRVARLEPEEAFDSDYETAIVLSLSGELLLKKEGERSSIEFSKSEVDQIEHAVFSHNHPTGGSFSPADVSFSIRANLHEMRAVGTDDTGQRWLYRLPRPDGGWPNLGKVQEAVRDANWHTQKHFEMRIEQGSLEIAQANREHWHTVWESIAESTGLIYQRIKL